MIRETSEFQADNKKQEIFPDNFEEFPFICWTRDLAEQEHYIDRCIHKSPGVYLNEYRLRMAAKMLLQTDEHNTDFSL